MRFKVNSGHSNKKQSSKSKMKMKMSKPNLEVLKELMQEGTFNLPDYSDPKYDEGLSQSDPELGLDLID
jgi:hypothetical protein